MRGYVRELVTFIALLSRMDFNVPNDRLLAYFMGSDLCCFLCEARPNLGRHRFILENFSLNQNSMFACAHEMIYIHGLEILEAYGMNGYSNMAGS